MGLLSGCDTGYVKGMDAGWFRNGSGMTIIPPVQPSKGSSESYPGEKEKLGQHSANDGFTIRDDTSEFAAESKRRIEENAAFIGRFLNGNEEQKRFANGIPVPGEAHQSISGFYVDAKNRSDHARQED